MGTVAIGKTFHFGVDGVGPALSLAGREMLITSPAMRGDFGCSSNIFVWQPTQRECSGIGTARRYTRFPTTSYSSLPAASWAAASFSKADAGSWSMFIAFVFTEIQFAASPVDADMAARFADLKGDILVAKGKPEEARAAYKEAVDALAGATKSEASALREIAQAKLDAVGSVK